MSSNPLLTLTSKGILTGVGERIDTLLAYLMTSNASQSNLYKGEIKSLQGLIQATDGNNTLLQSSIEAAIIALFGAQFDAVSCSVVVAETATDGTNRKNIAIDIVVVENGTNYKISPTIPVIDGIIQSIITSNNG